MPMAGVPICGHEVTSVGGIDGLAAGRSVAFFDLTISTVDIDFFFQELSSPRGSASCIGASGPIAYLKKALPVVAKALPGG